MLRYEKYTGNGPVADLSDSDITTIGAKAFLSCREVEKLILPDTLIQAEDWAFAHMKRLKELVLPAKEIQWGKQVFLGCSSLERVTLSQVSMLPGLSSFLATVFTCFTDHTPDFLASLASLDGQKAWLSEYDQMLQDFLEAPDEQGFVPAFIGWFDVEDVDDQKLRYLQERRLLKARLAFQRLQTSENLSPAFQSCFENCLLSQKDLILQQIQESTFPEQNNISFYHILHASGGLDTDTAAVLLDCESVTDAEVRSFLIGLQTAGQNGDSFFDNLGL